MVVGTAGPRAWQRHRVLFALLGTWVLVTLALGEAGDFALTAEFFGLLAATACLVVGRGAWTWPFAAWFAALVGLDQLGMLANLGGAPHAGDVIAFEHRLFGADTVTAVQSAWHRSSVQWWDRVLVAVYWMHSYAPVLLGILLWLGRRTRGLFISFAASTVVAGTVALAVYILFPETPPWLAAIRGQMPPVHRVAAEVMQQATWMYSPWYGGGPRPEGAMPSMHVGIAVLVAVYAIRAWRWRAAPVALYPLAMSLSVVYLGEHFAVDALAGIVVAGLAVPAATAFAGGLSRTPGVAGSRLSGASPGRGRPWPAVSAE